MFRYTGTSIDASCCVLTLLVHVQIDGGEPGSPDYEEPISTCTPVSLLHNIMLHAAGRGWGSFISRRGGWGWLLLFW